MPDFTNRITTIYRAETSGAENAVKRYRGVEREEAKKVLDSLNEHNAKLQEQIATYAKVAAAIGGVVALYKSAQTAAKAYLEDVRLESASAGANVERLTDATRGLVEHDKLLEFAGKAMHGTWKLNQGEMERVLHGALALRKTMGVELIPTIDALTESIAKGNTKALHEFGIEARDKRGVLKELDGIYEGLHGNVGLAGDKFQTAGVKLHDAFDDLEGQLGKLVIKLTPAIDALASFVGWLVKGFQAADRWTDKALGVDTQGGTRREQLERQVAEMRAQAQRLRTTGRADEGHSRLGFVSQIVGGAGDFASGPVFDEKAAEALAGDLERQANDLLWRDSKRYSRELGTKAGAAIRDVWLDVWEALKEDQDLHDDIVDKVKKGRGHEGLTVADVTGAAMSRLDPLGRSIGRSIGSIVGNIQGEGLNADARSRAQARIDDEFSKWTQELPAAMERARAALVEANTDIQRSMLESSTGFQLFRDSALSAFEVLIEGGDRMSERLRKAFAGILHGQAVKLAGVAIEEGVMAFVDPAMSAKHLTAAAKAAAGAAALGALAAKLGGGGSSPSAPAALGAAGAGAGAGGESGPVTYQINVLSDFSGDSPRRTTRRLSRALDDVRRMRGGKRSVEFG